MRKHANGKSSANPNHVQFASVCAMRCESRSGTVLRDAPAMVAPKVRKSELLRYFRPGTAFWASWGYRARQSIRPPLKPVCAKISLSEAPPVRAHGMHGRPYAPPYAPIYDTGVFGLRKISQSKFRVGGWVAILELYYNTKIRRIPPPMHPLGARPIAKPQTPCRGCGGGCPISL